jgi:hypothetical protein
MRSAVFSKKIGVIESGMNVEPQEEWCAWDHNPTAKIYPAFSIHLHTTIAGVIDSLVYIYSTLRHRIICMTTLPPPATRCCVEHWRWRVHVALDYYTFYLFGIILLMIARLTYSICLLHDSTDQMMTSAPSPLRVGGRCLHRLTINDRYHKYPFGSGTISCNGLWGCT